MCVQMFSRRCGSKKDFIRGYLCMCWTYSCEKTEVVAWGKKNLRGIKTPPHSLWVCSVLRKRQIQTAVSVGLQIILSFIRLSRVLFYCHVLYCTVSMSSSPVHLNVPEHAQFHHQSFMSGIVFTRGGNRAELLLLYNGSLLMFLFSLCVRVPLRWRLSFFVNENMPVMSG